MGPRSQYRSPFILRVLILVGACWTSAVSANTGPAITGITARAENAQTAISNPAGLTRLDRPEWLGRATVFLSENEDRATGDFFDGQIESSSDNTLLIPFIYYARPITDKLAFGASVTAPGGFGGDPDDRGPGRYLLDEWTLIYISLTPAIGYRINDQLSVGAAINFNYANYEYESAVLNLEPGSSDGRMKIEADDFTFSGQISLLWELSDRTRIGLNYRSESDTELSDTPSFSGLGPAREALLEMGGALSQKLSFETVLPQAVNLGLFHEFGNGTDITIDLLWMEFSAFGLTEFAVGGESVETRSQDYEDVWGTSIGFSYPINDRWTAKAGVALTSEFIKDTNRTRSFRMDRFTGFGLGAEYRWKDNRILGFNLHYFDMGDAPVETEIPLLGTIQEEYDENFAVGLEVTLRWIR